jgi:glycosyltransferase involved in cell wall biosynthesis
MHLKIGYLVSEFPGQTHIFFWREITVLEEQGAAIDLVSTQKPPAKLMSHTWTEAAQQRTTYLFPPKEHWLEMLVEFLRCGPQAWFRCFAAILSAKGLSRSGKLRLIALMGIGAELSALARKHQWDHLHVHSCGDAAHIAMFASLLSHLPYSLTLHGPLKDYGPNQAQKWEHASFGLIITQSLMNEVKTQLAGHLPILMDLAPMGVNVTQFSRRTAYTPWSGAGPCRVFSCGRLNPCKGHQHTIAAIALLRSQGIDATLEIAGEDDVGGGYRADLEQQIQSLGLTDAVHLLGAVSEDRIRAGLENAHVFVLASRNEPLGVAIMEAMALQLPVVVTNSEGVRELINDKQEGWLIPPQSPAQIAAVITQILQDPNGAIQVGVAARQKIVTQFHASRSAEAMINGIRRAAIPIEPQRSPQKNDLPAVRQA